MLNMSRTPCFCPRNDASNAAGSIPGKGVLGPEPINDQRAEREPDALLEFVGLGEGRPVDIGCELFGGRRHGGFAPGGASGPAPHLIICLSRQPSPALAETPLAYGHRARQCHLPAINVQEAEGAASCRSVLTLPPAFSIAAAALFDATSTSKVALVVNSPTPRTLTPSRLRVTIPAFMRLSTVIGSAALSLPASIAR